MTCQAAQLLTTTLRYFQHKTGRAQSLQMQVINVAGMIVHTQTIASPDEIIHLDHLPAGMYIIRLENGNMIKTLKAIKIQ